MDETLRTVKYSASDSVKFDKVALKLGRPKRLVFSQMVDYFHRTKKDPLDVGDEVLRNTILKGQKDHIGFIRTQETELLIPIKRDVSRMAEAMQNIVDRFNAQVLRHNGEIIESQLKQGRTLDSLSRSIGNIEGKTKSADLLKRSFMLLLDAYIRERVSFSIMTSAKEKEELADRVRRQIELL